MDEKIKLLAKDFGLEKVKFNEVLSPHTSLNTGGIVKLFAVALTQREVIKLVEGCRELKIPFLIMGSGSKMMISDKGFDGVIIKNRTQNIKITSIKGKVKGSGLGVDSVLLEVESGVTISQLVTFLEKQRLEKDRFLRLPGSMGGNIFINKGLQEITESIKVLNLDSNIEIIPVDRLSLRMQIVISIVIKIKSL